MPNLSAAGDRHRRSAIVIWRAIDVGMPGALAAVPS